MLSIKVTGTDGIKRTIDDAIKYVASDIEADFQDWGNDTVKIARKIHKFGHPYSKGYQRTGNADRAIKAQAKGASVKIYIDPDTASVNSKKYGKFNYAWAQHDGTKRGIKADPFIENAIEQNKDKLSKRIMASLKRILG